MSVTFDEKDLDKAIKDAKEAKEAKDDNRVWLKGTTMNAMWNDPTFEYGETEKLLERLKNEIPEIFEVEKQLPYEKRLDPSLWDEDYFAIVTYWFKENFAESRIPYIKEVGRAVYKQKKQNGSGASDKETKKAQPPTSNKEDRENSQEQKETGNFHLSGMIVAVIILVIVLILLIRNLIK